MTDYTSAKIQEMLNNIDTSRIRSIVFFLCSLLPYCYAYKYSTLFARLSAHLSLSYSFYLGIRPTRSKIGSTHSFEGSLGRTHQMIMKNFYLAFSYPILIYALFKGIYNFLVLIFVICLQLNLIFLLSSISTMTSSLSSDNFYHHCQIIKYYYKCVKEFVSI